MEGKILIDRKIEKITEGRWFLGGSAQVKRIEGRSICCFTTKEAKYGKIKDNGMAILYYEENPKIIVANPKIELIRFKNEKRQKMKIVINECCGGFGLSHKAIKRNN